MDQRKSTIRELEDKKRADTETRNRLLEGLGKVLFQRIGDREPFPENPGAVPEGMAAGEITAEYRKLQKEISDSQELIKSLEAQTLRLRELEQQISAGEEEKSRLEKELAEIHVRLGKAMLEKPGLDDIAGPLREQEEVLNARIGEQEKKIRDLEDREGGILAWLGKNAQIAVSRTLLSKNKSALERLHYEAGEKFLSAGAGDTLEGDAAADAGKAGEIKGRLSSMAGDLSGLKGERRKIAEHFGVEGSPARRIQGLEKRIAFVQEEFPAVFLRLGSLAAESGSREALASVLKEEDHQIFEKAELLKSQIDKGELAIQKIKAAISIDNEKAEIERTKRAILNQQQKIAAASNAISDMERQIAESEKRIDDLQAFLRENE